jgi:hypothetical protein
MADGSLPTEAFTFHTLRRRQRVFFPKQPPSGYHAESIVLREREMNEEEEKAKREKGDIPQDGGNRICRWKVKSALYVPLLHLSTFHLLLRIFSFISSDSIPSSFFLLGKFHRL